MSDKRKVTFEFDDSQADALDNMTDWEELRPRPCDRCGYDWNSGSLWLYHDASTEPSVRCNCGHKVHADTAIEATKRWNTRISFDWLATVAALQMWKDEQRLRREDYEAFEDARSGHALAERLLTEATQTLDRLCGDGEQDAVVRELSGKLNEWLKEAMPF